MERTYICIDLKSFYASVECVERGLDPLGVNLVVADSSRTEKTICLAVTPSLKAYGIPGRARLFEVIQKVELINAGRRQLAPKQRLCGTSYSAEALASDPSLALGYITASPRMALYIKYSTMIYEIYLKYVAPEDIHVYSVDEVFMDVTPYLDTYKLTAHELAIKIIRDVLKTTGITATVGIGTNMYLAKIAMDIVAKHTAADSDGVRIAELDELSYRRLLWDHRPLTDFWRIGRGYAKKLEQHGMYTMGDVARCSIGRKGSFHSEELLYKLFGINAELLIDHAWGWEPCTIDMVKAYRPIENSLSSGQVLKCPYTFDKARLIVKEMAEQLTLSIVDKGLAADQIVLTIGYDTASLDDPDIKNAYNGRIRLDHYGRAVPEHAHGTANLEKHSSSSKQITAAATELFDMIADPLLLVRRITITANHIVREETVFTRPRWEQLDIFTDCAAADAEREAENTMLRREHSIQKALLKIRRRYGKNAVIKGMNLLEGGTTIERNCQIGGHRA